MKGTLAALCAVAAATTLAACGGSNTSSKGSPATAGGGATGALEITSAEVEPTGAAAEVAPGTKQVVTVKLTPGVQWSDGTPLTAADFVGQYAVLWAQQDPVWQSLTDVKAVDDETLVFETSELSPNTIRLLLRWNQTASRSQFGAQFDRLEELRRSGAKPDAPEVAKTLEQLQAVKVDGTVAYGPYAVDPDSVTAQQLELSKNANGYNASKVDFDKVVVYWGSTQQTVPLLLSGKLDYTTDALTPSDQRAVAGRKDIELIRTPLGTGTGIWFNETMAPFDKKEFRQAVAYAIDRARNARIALGDAAKPIERMAGFSDGLAEQWLGDDVELDGYARDPDKAAELLEGIGLSQEGGKWKDASGKPVKFEITAPTDFPDFLASAKDVSAQLNDFGFATKVRGIPAASRPDVIKQGRYEAMLDFSLVSTPSHPQTSLDWNMAAGFFGTNNPEAKGKESKGLAWPWRQTTPDGDEVYIPDLLAQAVKGLDTAPQREAVETLAQIFNDQLPIVPIFERYTTDPIAHGPRVDGWLPSGDPLYRNNQGSDNYTSIQLLSGVLKPAAGGDGTFHTSAPYLQPPDNSFNYYAANSLTISFTSPTYDLSFPPLFWYSEAEQVYFPAVGTSYSIRTL